MKFSEWMNKRLNEDKKSQPVQMPKEISNKIKIKPAKDRLPGGRVDTSFDSRPKRLKTRSSQKRAAFEE
jgi:hypothetical protein